MTESWIDFGIPSLPPGRLSQYIEAGNAGYTQDALGLATKYDTAYMIKDGDEYWVLPRGEGYAKENALFGPVDFETLKALVPLL